jgi:hypothetical protein
MEKIKKSTIGFGGAIFPGKLKKNTPPLLIAIENHIFRMC